jgi:hypothetical protein
MTMLQARPVAPQFTPAAGRGAIDALAHYTRQSLLSDPGRHAALASALPPDPAAIVRAVQGLMIYEHVAAEFYGISLDQARRGESHVRSVEAIIDRILEIEGRPLTETRAPGERFVGICRSFTLLAVGLMRAKGIPARARCGFGAYFNPGKFEDHWVCEYWSAAEHRWALADPQFDAIWIERFGLDHDPMDVPRDRFLTGGAAWRMCREGWADPDKFGIEFSQLRGLWFVAGDLIRDVAALCGMEMLAWDVWGMQPQPGWQPTPEELAFLDELARLTADPDAHLVELLELYRRDLRVKVPDTVLNALRERREEVSSGR